MKALRKRNALIFDVAIFLGFTVASFAAYVLTDWAGTTGAVISITLLGIICLSLIISR